jgi:hypothetical protein
MRVARRRRRRYDPVRRHRQFILAQTAGFTVMVLATGVLTVLALRKP